MFRNTSLSRECFFASPCFHDARNPGAAAGIWERLGIPAHRHEAQNVIGSNAIIKAQFRNFFASFIRLQLFLNRKANERGF
jgi:hypothetical protein